MLAFLVTPEHGDQRIELLGQLVEKLGCKLLRRDSISAVAEDPGMRAATNSILIIPSTSSWKPKASEVIDLASKLSEHVFVFYIAEEISPSDYKALLRRGAAESSDWKSATREISDAVRRLQSGEKEKKETAQPSKHKLVSFIAAGGGVGNTTIAMETGIYLSSLKGENALSTAFLDLQFGPGEVCDYLDINPRLNMAEIARDPQRLDDYMLEIFASKHASGLSVFCCKDIWQVDEPIDEAIVFLLLNRLLERYDVVLLDLPRHPRLKINDILRNSDLTFVTGLFSVPSVKRVTEQLRSLSNDLQIHSNHLAAILTDAETNVFGKITHRFSVESVLDIYTTFYVRRDRSFALECVDSGYSMLQTDPNRGICRDIEKIAERVAELAETAPQS